MYKSITLCLLFSAATLASAQTPASPAATTPQQKSCTVNRTPPTPSETLLNRGDNTAAEKSFRDDLAKDPHNAVAREGLIRALIEQDKVIDAAKEASAWLASDPNDTMALTASGEVLFRQGDVRPAFFKFQSALKADLCNPRAYVGFAHIYVLTGARASLRRNIDQAHTLHPTDDEIDSIWVSTLPRKERLAAWAEYVAHSDQISDENRARMKERLAKESLYQPTDCRMAPTSPTSAKVPIVSVTDGPTHFIGWGLDVNFNGKRRRLQIDTGASGITISRAAALMLGITREDQSKIGGIGDQGDVKSSIARVASIKIGSVEFTNCHVEILEKWGALDTDGLIGADVFAASAVTLDFPKHELRIDPLPARPDEPKSDVAVGEPVLHDPYIAPEMKDWQRIYRSGHQLLIPATIVETRRIKEESALKEKIFLLDTGAFDNLISPAAAAEVTHVSHSSDTGIHGISGEVKKVYEAGKFTLSFNNLRVDAPSMNAIDLTRISHGAGIEVSGLIGGPALFQVTMHIDYRDNLVWLEYKPK